MITFDVAIERVLTEEGGYVNNPRDPGGETKWGISKRMYPNVDIANLTRDDAKEIYRRDFWVPIGVGLDDAHKFMVLDAAVNHGIGNAVRMMQRAVGVADDGVWGPHSQSCYENQDKNDTGFKFYAERLDFMAKLLTWDSFGRGWARRIAADLRWAAGDI